MLTDLKLFKKQSNDIFSKLEMVCPLDLKEEEEEEEPFN